MVEELVAQQPLELFDFLKSKFCAFLCWSFESLIFRIPNKENLRSSIGIEERG